MGLCNKKENFIVNVEIKPINTNIVLLQNQKYISKTFYQNRMKLLKYKLNINDINTTLPESLK